MRVVLDEAEAAGRLSEAIEAHDEALDLANLAEELVDLLFCGVEGTVRGVSGGARGEWAGLCDGVRVAKKRGIRGNMCDTKQI